MARTKWYLQRQNIVQSYQHINKDYLFKVTNDKICDVEKNKLHYLSYKDYCSKFHMQEQLLTFWQKKKRNIVKNNSKM